MSRIPDPGFDPRVADWLEADPVTAPPEVLRTVTGALPSIPQRQVIRLPRRSVPVSRFLLVAATAILVGALGVGVVAVGGRPPSIEASPPPVASPSPTPPSGGGSLAAYVAAHDAICRAGVARKDQLSPRYAALFTAGATEEQRADGIEAANEMAAVVEDVARDLLALEAPPEVLVDHVQYATRMEDVAVLIRRAVLLFRAGRDAEALAVDETTNAINARVGAFEQEYGLEPCP